MSLSLASQTGRAAKASPPAAGSWLRPGGQERACFWYSWAGVSQWSPDSGSFYNLMVTAHVTHFPEKESEIHRFTALTLGSQNDSGCVAQSLRGGQALWWCRGPGLGLGLQPGHFWVLACSELPSTLSHMGQAPGRETFAGHAPPLPLLVPGHAGGLGMQVSYGWTGRGLYLSSWAPRWSLCRCVSGAPCPAGWEHRSSGCSCCLSLWRGQW